MTARRASDPPPEDPAWERVLPMQLRAGDLVLDRGEEWEIVGHVESMRSGKAVRVSMQRPGRPETHRQEIWPAHEGVRVRRASST